MSGTGLDASGETDVAGETAAAGESVVAGESAVAGEAVPRRRDAAGTRRLLLEAATRRFTVNGYAATPVREIADEAGVNVSLINRYFTSKEGLFEACLAEAAAALSTSIGRLADLAGVADTMSVQAIGPERDDKSSYLLLLLRTSGDERAERMRTDILRDLAERLAALAGWTPDHPDGDDLLLRAQLVLCTGVGMAVLRATGGLEPLCTTDKKNLATPMGDLVRAMLG